MRSFVCWYGRRYALAAWFFDTQGFTTAAMFTSVTLMRPPASRSVHGFLRSLPDYFSGISINGFVATRVRLLLNIGCHLCCSLVTYLKQFIHWDPRRQWHDDVCTTICTWEIATHCTAQSLVVVLQRHTTDSSVAAA